MPKLELTPQQRRDLRATAHPLHPVVLIGDRGLTASVQDEIDRSLTVHELIKVRVAGADRDAREAMLASLCEALSCAAVHHIGKTLIIYRPDANKQQASVAPMVTRATRRKSDPYVPKKQAANGPMAKPAARRTAARGPKVEPSATARRTTTSGTGSKRRTADAPSRIAAGRVARAVGVAHGTERHSGSALSLRAGARRGRTTRS